MSDATTTDSGEQGKGGLPKWVALIPVVLILATMGAIGYHHATRNKVRHEAGSLTGEQLYRAYCGRCHMPDLKGAGAYPGLLGREVPPEEFRQLVLQGKGLMPAFPELVEGDVERLRAYVDERRAGGG
ncbi:MAG: cytochrome c [Planctomycetes bacterium]|nr:cytochrome c [Planctomycetota bacterium]